MVDLSQYEEKRYLFAEVGVDRDLGIVTVNDDGNSERPHYVVSCDGGAWRVDNSGKSHHGAQIVHRIICEVNHAGLCQTAEQSLDKAFSSGDRLLNAWANLVNQSIVRPEGSIDSTGIISTRPLTNSLRQ